MGGTDGFMIAALVVAGFFGFFALTMSLTSMRYAFLNMTNVDMLSFRSKVYQLAVHVPTGTAPTDKFSMVTYPLPRLELGINGEANKRTPARVNGAAASNVNGTHTAQRDGLATRTFAILKTQAGENPWDLGMYENWKAVMGTNPIDWLLPVRKSPCVKHESPEGFYPMGRVLARTCARNGVACPTDGEREGVEMSEVTRDSSARAA